MYKITDSTEEIIKKIKEEFNEEYEISIDNEVGYNSIVRIKSNIVFLSIMIYNHEKFDRHNISNSYTHRSITFIDYFGNKHNIISSDYINEIKNIIQTILDKMDKYFDFVKEVITNINKNNNLEYLDLDWIVNDKYHFFIKFKKSILCIKPLLNLNNGKIIMTINTLFSNYNEPVLQFDIDTTDIDTICEGIEFFLF